MLLPEPMPVLPAPLVPVEDCSRRHFARSSPVSESHSPLLEPVEAAPLVALPPTLVSGELLERGAVVPAEPAVSPLVPVDGGVDVPLLEGVAAELGGAEGVAADPDADSWLLDELPEPMLEPDWVCAIAEEAASAAAVAMQRMSSFMQALL